MDKQPPAAASPVTGPRILLGAFILWQLTFLFGVNFLEMINWARGEMPKDKEDAQGVERVLPGWPSKSGHFHDLADVADKITRRYAQLTGQTQGWSLFAPDIGKHCVFPAVLVRWDEDPSSALALSRPLSPLAATNPLEAASLRAAGAAARPAPAAPATILSANEPQDIQNYFRVGNFRLRRLEGNLSLVFRQKEEETPAAAADRWRDSITELLHENGNMVQAYLGWRWASYRQSHPEAPPPKQLILIMRRYAIVAPAKAPPYWQGPFTVPVARLQPDVQWIEGHSPLEMYNPVSQRFQEVSK
jgi:hypothetical protein